MKPPIEGMKRVPYGLPLMFSAWLGCVYWAIEEESIRKAFKDETGMDVSRLASESPIERMVDQATGYQKDIVMAFLDFVTERLWGEEESTDENEPEPISHA